MLVHEQIPNLDVKDNISETGMDWEAQIDFVKHLNPYTLMEKRETLIANKKLIPLIAKVMTMVGLLRDQYFYEFELASHNIVITVETDDANSTECDFMMVNQPIPFVYRNDLANMVEQIYDEKEYEFNENLILKKIASFFVTIATENEPENNTELLDTLQKWHDNRLADAPKETELNFLLELAYKAMESLKTPENLLSMS